MTHILYKTVNKINGKYYIGRHSTKRLNDGYLGSGTLLKKALKRYGRENFIFEILETFDSYELLIEAEKRLVDDVLGDPDCYNLNVGGLGGTSRRVWTEERREKHRKSIVEKMTEEWKTSVSSAIKQKHEKSGRSYWTEEGLETLRQKSLGNCRSLGHRHSLETRQQMSNSRLGKKRSPFTEKHRKALSLARRGKGKGVQNAMSSPENRKKVSSSKIGRKKMISPDGKIYMIPKDQQEEKLQQGFTFSRS